MPNIIVKNTTSQARTGLVTVGVPLSRAFNLNFTDVLVVNNAKTGVSNLKVQWYGVGNRYDNSAYKYARVTFEVDLTANQEKTVSLTKATGATIVTELSYVPNLSMPGNIAGTIVELNIEGQTYSYPMSTLINSTNKIEGSGNKDFYRRQKYFTHLPATSDPRRRYLWVDMVLDIPARLEQCTFFFRYGYYRDFPVTEPNRPEPVFNLSQNITLRVIGPRTKIRWEEYKVPSIQTISSTHKLYTLVNRSQPGADKFAAGSSNVYKGVFCYGNTSSDTAELENPILAIAEDWKLTENYPVTGVMPEYPSYVTSEANALTRSETLRNFLEARIKNPSYKGPYNWSTIVNEADTTRTGTHGLRDYAYGMRGMPILRPLNYNFIPLLEFSTRQEGLRHIFFYGTDGNPIPPGDFLNNGVLIFHSRHFWAGSTRGFSRSTEASDCAKVPHDGTSIYGPDRQHHTVKMAILQGFISMDWYSLEFAKMSVNNWINNNRSDTSNVFINTWEAARALGRTYENAAFLYEFTYDQSLKFFVEQNLNFNLAFTGNPNSGALNKTVTPGGTEILRRSLDFTTCAQGACLGPLSHWRPWEESAVTLGLFCLSKAISRSEPNSALAAKTLEIARDVSASLVNAGYIDCSPNSSRRVIIVQLPSSAARLAFQNALGSTRYSVPIVGQTSGATGVVFLHHREQEWGVPGLTHRVWLAQATGTFQVGETITSIVGVSATVVRTFNFVGRKSYASSSPTNGQYRALTSLEEEEVSTDDPNNFSPADHPMGYFKYHRLYYVYNSLLMSAPAIAKLAAASSYYGVGNSGVIAKSDQLISNFAVDEDNGDFEESTSRFYGYIDANFSGSDTTYVTASPLVSSIALISPTVNVITTSVNTQVDAASSLIRVRPSNAQSVATNGSTDVTINVPSQSIRVTQGSASPSASTIIGPVGTISAITVGPQNVDSVVTTSALTGFRKTTYVYIGQPLSVENPSFVHEAPSYYPGTSAPTVFNFHKTLVLRTLTSSSIITDYYLHTPVNPVIGAVGESIGINGQTLGLQGYTWTLPGTSVYATTDYTVNRGSTTHYISQAGRGAAIRSWSTNVGGDDIIDWLKADGLTEGIVMNEVYDTNIPLSTRKKYTPNFLGATTTLTGDEYTFVSPNRIVRSSLVRSGRVIEGAVTPLELVSYQPPYQDLGGSLERPAIAASMKMYYNLACETDIEGVSQLDFWTHHVNGIPSGSHNLSALLKLNIRTMFDQMYMYDIGTSTFNNLSALLLNINQEIKFSQSNTLLRSDAIGPTAVTLPSYLPSGRGALMCADSSRSFIMAIVAGLDSASNSLNNVNYLTFENTAFSPSITGSHSLGISSVDNYTPGTSEVAVKSDVETEVSDIEFELTSVLTDIQVRRTPGWAGRRAYIIFGSTYEDVIEKIQSIEESVGVRSTIDDYGLHPYERPAII